MREMRKLSWILVLVFIGGFFNNSSARSRIAFIRAPVSEMCDAFVANLDGSNCRQVTSSHSIACAKWLDSKTLAVISGEDSSHGDIWLVSINDDNSRGQATQLTKFGDVVNLSCSSDGKRLAFCRDSFYKGTSERIMSLAIIYRNGKDYQILKKIDANYPLDDLISCFGGQYLFYAANNFDNSNEPFIARIDLANKQEKVIFSLPYSEPHGLSCDGIFSLDCSKDCKKLVFTGYQHRDSYGNIVEQYFLKSIDPTKNNGENAATILQKSQPLSCFSFMAGEEAAMIDYNTQGEEYDIYSLNLVSKRFELFLQGACSPDVWY